MGQYLYTGIVTRVVVDNLKDMRGLEGYYKFLPLEMYNTREVKNNKIELTIKEDILKDNLVDFLKEQYELLEDKYSDVVFEELDKIKDSDNYLHDLKEINEQSLYTAGEPWGTLDLLSYVYAGKIAIEGWGNYFSYHLNALRKSGDNPLYKTLDYVIS